MCSIQSHQNQKVAIQDGTIYLQGPRLGQVRLEPSLNINQLPVEIPLLEMLEMQTPSAVMVAYFLAIACELKEEKPRSSGASNISSPGSWTPIDLVQLDLMEEASRLMKSPSKLKMGPFLAEMAASAQLGGPKLESLSSIQLDNLGKPTLDEQNLFLITSGWNNLITNVLNIKERMDTHSKGDKAFREALAGTIAKLQGAIDLTDGKVKIMSTHVGDTPDTLVDQSINVWEAIESIQAELDATNTLLSSGKEEVAERGAQLEVTDLRLDTLGKSYNNLSGSYKQHQALVSKLNRSIKTLELKVKLAGEREYAASGTDGLRRGEYAEESAYGRATRQAEQFAPATIGNSNNPPGGRHRMASLSSSAATLREHIVSSSLFYGNLNARPRSNFFKLFQPNKQSKTYNLITYRQENLSSYRQY
jgi:hypothetical protein